MPPPPPHCLKENRRGYRTCLLFTFNFEGDSVTRLSSSVGRRVVLWGDGWLSLGRWVAKCRETRWVAKLVAHLLAPGCDVAQIRMRRRSDSSLTARAIPGSSPGTLSPSPANRDKIWYAIVDNIAFVKQFCRNFEIRQLIYRSGKRG